jgi:O-antigen/teichoic acid export membrane protein
MLKNISSGWLNLVVSVLAAYLLLKFNLRFLGEEQYGVLLVISSLTGYLTLLQLGVPMASVLHLTQAVESDDPDAVSRLVTSCAGLYVGFGLLSTLVGLVLLVVFRAGFPVPAGLQGPATVAFLLILVNVGLGFVGLLPSAILNAHHEFVLKNVVLLVLVLVRVGLNVALVLWLPSLEMVAAALAAGTVAEMLILWGVTLRRHPEVRLRPSLFSLAVVRGILGFSVFVLLLNVGAQLSFQTDPIVISHFLGFEQVAYFSAANGLVLYLMQFIIGIAAVVMPMATKLQAQGRTDELRGVFLKWSKVSLGLTCCAGLFFLVFGPAFLANWLGEHFREPGGRVLRILTLSYLIFLPVRGVALPVLMGLGKAVWPTVAFFAAGVANAVLSIALAPWLGLDGVAWGTTIPNVVLAFVLLRMACVELGLSVSGYLKEVLPRAAVGFAAALLVLWLWQRYFQPESFPALVAAGVATVAATGLAWVGFVLHNDVHLPVPTLGRVLRRFAR